MNKYNAVGHRRQRWQLNGYKEQLRTKEQKRQVPKWGEDSRFPTKYIKQWCDCDSDRDSPKEEI